LPLIVFGENASSDEFVEVILDSLAAGKRDLKRHELRLTAGKNVGRNAETERIDQGGQFAFRLGNPVSVSEGEYPFL